MSSLENNNKIRRRWSEEEDEKLKSLLLSHAADNDNENHLGWTEVAEKIKTRNANQCRERWSNHLRPGIRRGEWTSEEDDAIVRLQKVHGNRWSMISSVHPLVGRTDIDIKNRWHVLQRRQVAAQMASLHTSTKCKSTTLTTTTPRVGMKVLVTFEEEKGFHKLYDGTITKVEEHPDVDDAFKLEIQYTDGSTEDAMYPDEDIYLVDCSQSTVDGLTEEEVSISAELLNIYLELSKNSSSHDGNKSKKPRMTTTSKTDDYDEEEIGGGGEIIFTKENQNVNLTPR